MVIGEIFDRLKKYLRQIFYVFTLFRTKEHKAKEDHLETKEESAERNAEVEGNLPPDKTKKPPIAQTESKERAQRDYSRKDSGEEEKIINLAQACARKTHVEPKRSIQNGEIKETKEKINNGETSDYEIAQPFMELNIDSKTVSLVLPEQRVKPDGSEQAFTELLTFAKRIEHLLTQINANQTQISADCRLHICDHLRYICENLR